VRLRFEVQVCVRRGHEFLDREHDDYCGCSAAEAHALLHWPEPREVLRELASQN
jgi:hypothetical protein